MAELRQFETFEVEGFQGLLRACDRAGKDTKLYVREALREVGESVRADAEGRFDKYDAKTAAGYRVRVRQRGVEVEQSLRKTTGTRPDFGVLQMRKALLPALADKEREVERRFERALGRIADHFDN